MIRRSQATAVLRYKTEDQVMAAYFTGTINALKRGITRMSIDTAVRNIENWEEALQEIEVSGCKAILRDLGALKKELQREEPDGERVRHLMARLGSQTVSISEKSENRYQEKIADLGHSLSDAADSDDEDDESSSSSRSKSQASGAKSGSASSSSGSRSARSSDDDEEMDRSSRGSGPSSRSSHQGEVKDPEHDGRLKQNRDRGISKQSDDDEDDYGSRARSSSSSSRSSGQGEVKDPEHDGRLKQNRDRGVSKQDDDEDDNVSRSRSRSNEGNSRSSSRSTSR
jgi:hypothetical protein